MGNSLGVQWLGLQASTAGGTSSVPGQGAGIPLQATWQGQKKKKLNWPVDRAHRLVTPAIK